MKKFVLKNSNTRIYQAETRFQNGKTPLSRIGGLGWIPYIKACLQKNVQ